MGAVPPPRAPRARSAPGSRAATHRRPRAGRRANRVLGAVGHTPESLEIDLAWIDEQVDGKPYGVDLIVPTTASPALVRKKLENIRALDVAGLGLRTILAVDGSADGF